MSVSGMEGRAPYKAPDIRLPGAVCDQGADRQQEQLGIQSGFLGYTLEYQRESRTLGGCKWSLLRVLPSGHPKLQSHVWPGFWGLSLRVPNAHHETLASSHLSILWTWFPQLRTMSLQVCRFPSPTDPRTPAPAFSVTRSARGGAGDSVQVHKSRNKVSPLPLSGLPAESSRQESRGRCFTSAVPPCCQP